MLLTGCTENTTTRSNHKTHLLFYFHFSCLEAARFSDGRYVDFSRYIVLISICRYLSCPKFRYRKFRLYPTNVHRSNENYLEKKSEIAFEIGLKRQSEIVRQSMYCIKYV